MKLHRNRWTVVGLACLLAVSAVPAPFMEWTGITVYAADAINDTCGENLTWKLENGTLTISGTGEMYNYVVDEAPWYSSRLLIKSVSIKDGATRIGDSAFINCKNLSSITIPNSVTSIAQDAFDGCNKLNSVIYLGTKEEWEKIQSRFPANIEPTFHIKHTWSDGKCTVCNCECTHTESTLVKTEAKAPTCTETGNIEYWTCSECGLKFRDEAGNSKLTDGNAVLPALTHHYPENPVQPGWNKTETSHWLECDRDDCSDQEGSIKEKDEHTYVGDICSVCGFKRTHVHDLSPVPAKEASCTEAGHKIYYVCSGCDSLFASRLGNVSVDRADLTIPATGHKYDGYLQAAEGHWQECSVCGEATAKESHNFSGSTCTTCGYQKPETEKEETNTDTETKTETNTTTTSSSGGSHHDSAEVTDNSQKGRWVQNEKGWYFRQNNCSYPKNGWSKLYWLGKEYWYYFDENGYMKLGWLDVNGDRYYLNPVIGTNSGKMLTGWQLIDQKWYYFSTEQGAKEGSLLRNTVTPDNYQVDQDGVWKQ